MHSEIRSLVNDILFLLRLSPAMSVWSLKLFCIVCDGWKYIHVICTISVNRRLDEWVDLDRFDLSSKLEDPNSKIKDVTVMTTDLSDGTDRKLTRNQKRKHDEINHVQKVRHCYLFKAFLNEHNTYFGRKAFMFHVRYLAFANDTSCKVMTGFKKSWSCKNIGNKMHVVQTTFTNQ